MKQEYGEPQDRQAYCIRRMDLEKEVSLKICMTWSEIFMDMQLN